MMSDWTLVRNLIKAMVVWSCAIFSLFMRLFLVKYLPGDIFINQGSAEIAAMVSALICMGIDKNQDTARHQQALAINVAMSSAAIQETLI